MSINLKLPLDVSIIPNVIQNLNHVRYMSPLNSLTSSRYTDTLISHGVGNRKRETRSKIKEFFVDIYCTLRTCLITLKRKLGLSPRLSIPLQHPQFHPIKNLANVGSGIWYFTLQSCLSQIKTRHPHVCIDDSLYLYARNDREKIAAEGFNTHPNEQLIFFPLSLSPQEGESVGHYTLFCVDRLRKSVEYFDSEGNTLSSSLLENLKNRFFPREPNAVVLINGKRIQWDNHNCGICVVSYCLRRSRGESFETITQNPLSPSDQENLRMTMARELLCQKR